MTYSSSGTLNGADPPSLFILSTWSFIFDVAVFYKYNLYKQRNSWIQYNQLTC